jgi:hypothetical protein
MIKLMKKVIVLLVALCIGITFTYAENDKSTDNSAATTSMTGKVIDKVTGETLAGVMVSLEGTDKHVFSDFDGNFTFEDLKPAEYSLTCSLISYEKNEIKVKLGQDKDEIKVKMESVN